MRTCELVMERMSSEEWLTASEICGRGSCTPECRRTYTALMGLLERG